MPAVVTFFLLTFAVTWAAWLIPAAFAPRVPGLGLGGPVFLVGVIAPGLVALALTGLYGGRRAVAALVAPIAKWDVHCREGEVLTRVWEGALC